MAAQAARLSLRMQKELKLLIADPPYGACFPRLSSDSDQISLSSIHAELKGPEGSVYEDGVFEVEIRIPERYPFQPPIVTFSTPIYHPNIDTGGRICLDILNLPPKGAWQPSLNISTVMTSIGLLLSEPNPDDGLMCEASREYKYNRQAFDQKARSMTEKYARPGASGDSGASGSSQCNSMPSIMKTKPVEPAGKKTVESSEPVYNKENEAYNSHQLLVSDSENEVPELTRGSLKSNRQKLALQAPQSRERNEDKKGNVNSDCPEQDIGLCQKNSSVVDGYVNLQHKKMRWTLPKHPSGSSERIDVTEEKMIANPRSSLSETDASEVLDRTHLKPRTQKTNTDSIGIASRGSNSEKLCLGGQKLSSGLKGLSEGTKNKENVEPVLKSRSLSMKRLSGPEQHENTCVKKSHYDPDRSGMVDGKIRKQKEEEEEEELIIPESVIVLDSEDSEEEDKGVSLRSKPRLARKPLRKWKLRA